MKEIPAAEEVHRDKEELKSLRPSHLLTMATKRSKLASLFWLSLILISTMTGVTTANLSAGTFSKPWIMSESDTIVVDAGGTLNLTCRDRVPVVWVTHQHDLLYVNYEELYDAGHGRPYIANLVIENINYTNVGYYYCLHNTTENKMKTEWSPNDVNVSSIYVYVKDLINLLAKEAEKVVYNPVVNEPFIFPCKPTFPEVIVSLDKNQGTFDPREGFNFTLYEEDIFYCEATYEDQYVAKDFLIYPIDSNIESLEQPRVHVSDVWQKNAISEHIDRKEHYDIEEGSTVNLTCNYDHDMASNRYLEWTMPPTATNKSGNHLIYRDVITDRSLTRVHMITDANPLTDSGEYGCIASNTQKTKSDPYTVVINVLPHDYANVSLLPEELHMEAVPGEDETVRWMVMYSAYPEPTFIWRKGDEVLVNSFSQNKGDKRYKLDSNLHQGNMFLEIDSPTIGDIGNYTLEAVIKSKEKVIASDIANLTFTMQMKPSPPILELLPTQRKEEEMFQEGKSFNLTCKSQGYPKPIIALEFSQCFSKNNCTDFQIISKDQSLQANSLTPIPNDHSGKSVVNETAMWHGQAYVQGRYRCSAKNINDYKQSEIRKFLVTDGGQKALSIEVTVNGESTEEQQFQNVLEDDNITIHCRGNRIRTSPMFIWKLNNATLSVHNVSERLKATLEQVDTNLSYVSEIRINRIALQEEELEFSCQDAANLTLKAVHTITVKPMEAPKWTTRGGSSPLQNHDLTEMGNLNLSCAARGAPSPQIKWYKDDVLLQASDDKKHRSVQGSMIIFRYLKISDSGKYKCEAISRAGAISSEANIIVTDPDAFANINIIITVGVLSLILIILSTIFCRKLYKDRKRLYSIRLEDQRMFEQGDPDSINPGLGIDEQADLLPYDTKYEVSRDSIIFDKLLGAGAFGRVYRATAVNLSPGHARTTVAVKMMKSRTDCAQLKALRSEVKIMIHIGRHVNIVNLLGACSKDLASKGELLLLVEYCRYGNILDYMRRHRKDFINQINDNDKIDPSLTDARLRQRSASGSRSRMSRGLKYAHLSFNQDTVMYTPGQDPIHEDSYPSVWVEPTSPTGSIGGANGHIPPETFRGRTTSSSSGLQVASDMSIMTLESSGGGSDGYVGSRVVGPNPINLCSKELLCWAFQIARGMEYLAFKKILHGDLAARNILLTEDNVVKISDFGLAKDIYKNDYTKKSKTPVPWKWLALESFRDGVFSTQSDIWSYGVVLWEIFTLGQIPYPGVEFDDSFIAKLDKGIRLEQPKYSTFDLYHVMLDCWCEEPMERPNFSTLESRLGEMLGETEKQHYLELNTPYQMENTGSTFLNFLQSPDYTSKVRERSPNLDSDGYEMPFSPGPYGGMALTPGPLTVHSPRLTPLQMTYSQNYDAGDSENTAGTYMSMSSPTKMNQNVFKFDEATLDSISKRDSEIQQETDQMDGIDGMDKDTYLTMENSPNTKNSPGYNGQPKTAVPLRHKVVRTASQMEKHDSGLYSPTAHMQVNPHYVLMDTFPKTNEDNYLTKEDVHDMHNANHQYINLNDVKITPKPNTRDCANDGICNGEYANLMSNGSCRGRTISEASSGLGSISEESPPECRIKPDSLKSSVMESPIIEEALPLCA